MMAHEESDEGNPNPNFSDRIIEKLHGDWLAVVKPRRKVKGTHQGLSSFTGEGNIKNRFFIFNVMNLEEQVGGIEMDKSDSDSEEGGSEDDMDEKEVDTSLVVKTPCLGAVHADGRRLLDINVIGPKYSWEHREIGFLTAWLSHDEYESVVMKAWYEGSESVGQKLRKVQEDFLILNKEAFGYILNQKKSLERHIREVEKHLKVVDLAVLLRLLFDLRRKFKRPLGFSFDFLVYSDVLSTILGWAEKDVEVGQNKLLRLGHSNDIPSAQQKPPSEIASVGHYEPAHKVKDHVDGFVNVAHDDLEGSKKMEKLDKQYDINKIENEVNLKEDEFLDLRHLGTTSTAAISTIAKSNISTSNVARTTTTQGKGFGLVRNKGVGNNKGQGKGRGSRMD
ncbi:hypothetical protein RJT34_00840 [Clitoria ternatea]|uniref:Uncharacterized protein n=1 Tax=Clitoria ternatea TaxID=43366 RepID=A0AAN9KHL9_CLITE